MSRSSRRAEAARKEAAEKDFVHTAADRVGPLAQSAAEKVGPLAVSAADVIGAAADKVSPLAHSAANRVGPLAQTAAERVGPLAQTAADKIAPLASSAAGRVGPYANRVAPLAATAKLRGTTAAAATRDKVTGDLLPKLSVALGAAAASPLVAEASNRAEATLAAAKGELTLPKKKGGSRAEAALAAAKGELTLAQKKPKRRWVKRIVVIGGLGAVAVVVVRRFLGSQDADWQAARPSAPYVPPTPPSTSAPADTVTDTAGAAGVSSEAMDVPLSGDGADLDTAEATGTAVLDQPAEAAIDEEPTPAVEEDFAATEPAPVRMLNVTDSGDVEETVVDEVVFSESVPDLPETEPVAESPAGEEPVSPGRAPRWSGEGVYVGHEPPEGFVIKGNERSKKYHLPESAGYARTTGEVWFNSEEAAQQAGFVRAQR